MTGDSGDRRRGQTGRKVERVVGELFSRGIDIPRSPGFTAWSVFGAGVPGLKGVLHGFPGVVFLGGCAAAFWMFLRLAGGYVIYGLVLLLWSLIVFIVWRARPNIQAGRARMFFTATKAQIDEAIEQRRLAEASLLGGEKVERSRRGEISAVDHAGGLVWLRMFSDAGVKGEPDSFSFSLLDMPAVAAVPGCLCRVLESTVELGGRRVGTVRIVPDQEP